LSMLTAIAMRTSRIKLGTGILVLPLRNPTVLAKQIGSIDQISKGRFILGTAVGWDAREFGAVGVPFKQRGQIMGRNPESLNPLLGREEVRGEPRGGAPAPRPRAAAAGRAPAPADPDRRLRRRRVPADRPLRRRLANLLLHAGELPAHLGADQGLRRRGGPRP